MSQVRSRHRIGLVIDQTAAVPTDDPPDTFRELVTEAALTAERESGREEQTDEEARRSVSIRVARLVGGWLLVLIGIAGLPLPGPGWLIILLGLSLLPYAWAERTIRIIRQKIPGIPEDGRIPTR